MSEGNRRAGTARRSRDVLRRLGIGRIALRQLRSRPAPAIAEGLILAAAATLVATVVLIQNNITDQGLRSTIVAAGSAANVIIEQDGIAQPAVYDAFQQLAAAARAHATRQHRHARCAVRCVEYPLGHEPRLHR